MQQDISSWWEKTLATRRVDDAKPLMLVSRLHPDDSLPPDETSLGSEKGEAPVGRFVSVGFRDEIPVYVTEAYLLECRRLMAEEQRSELRKDWKK